MQTENNYYKILFFALLAILSAQRIIHLFGVIEEPMSWRQFDTEFFAYDFYKMALICLSLQYRGWVHIKPLSWNSP